MKKLLIANRGEIAIRIARAAAELPQGAHEPARGRGDLEAATSARVVCTAPCLTP